MHKTENFCKKDPKVLDFLLCKAMDTWYAKLDEPKDVLDNLIVAFVLELMYHIKEFGAVDGVTWAKKKTRHKAVFDHCVRYFLLLSKSL